LDPSVPLLTLLQMSSVWIAYCILNEEFHPSTEIILISVQIWIFFKWSVPCSFMRGRESWYRWDASSGFLTWVSTVREKLN
jgi:hypothetical protein